MDGNRGLDVAANRTAASWNKDHWCAIEATGPLPVSLDVQATFLDKGVQRRHNVTLVGTTPPGKGAAGGPSVLGQP